MIDKKIDFQIGYLAPWKKKERESDIFLHGKKEKKIATTRYPIPNRITSIRPKIFQNLFLSIKHIGNGYLCDLRRTGDIFLLLLWSVDLESSKKNIVFHIYF